MDGSELRALRRRFGLTQAVVASSVGIAQPELSAIENGRRGTPVSRERIAHAIRTLARPTDGMTAEIRRQALAIFAKYGAADVRIFGSVARGTDRPGSDVDFIATFPDGFSLFSMMALEEELEDLLGLGVDVVSDDPRAGRVLEAIAGSSSPLVASQ